MPMTPFGVPAPARSSVAPRAQDGRALPANARLVLDTLRTSDRPLKAYGILEQLHPHGITAPMTVYRALDRLIAAGLVRKIGTLNAFVALQNTPSTPVALVICRECHRTGEEPVDGPAAQWLAAKGAGPKECFIEIFTACATCDGD